MLIAVILGRVAQRHAKNMAEGNRAGHDVGDGGLLARVEGSGWTGFPVGENVAKPVENLKDVVGMWMW